MKRDLVLVSYVTELILSDLTALHECGSCQVMSADMALVIAVFLGVRGIRTACPVNEKISTKGPRNGTVKSGV